MSRPKQVDNPIPKNLLLDAKDCQAIEQKIQSKQTRFASLSEFVREMIRLFLKGMIR